MPKKPEQKPMLRCSCDEAMHLRRALRKILKRCTTVTDGNDLVKIANWAEQGLRLRPLDGEPNP